jgi:AP-5 complex subunit mu-1
VERQWQQLCENQLEAGIKHQAIPFDTEVAQAFMDRKRSEELEQGRGIREAVSQEGSDSWVDDIITRQVTSLQFSPKGMMLWPVLEHVRGSFYILVLPLVEPHHLAAYHELCCRSDCGGAATNHSLSSLLLDLPCITG